MRRRRFHSTSTRSMAELARAIGDRAIPVHGSADLDPLLERIGDARYVLIGEASHGTAEFYRWRAELSRRLIARGGRSFIAVEGDWPDCHRLNRFVRGLPGSGADAREVLRAIERWPTWLWANHEMVTFATWLRRHNERLPADDQVGFYGLDVYSLWESMSAVVAYLEQIDAEAARVARRAYRCFEPYGEDVEHYARTTALVPTSCEDEVVSILAALRRKAAEYAADDREAYFNAEQNAIVAREAERYYRAMIRGGPSSWNIRDHHMADTLQRLMRYHGPHARAIVWAHNTHVGDARFTDMVRVGMVNVGQLVREAAGADAVVLVGLGTHHGTVIAARAWGLPMERMRVPEARAGSYEEAMHLSGVTDHVLLFDGSDDGGIPGLEEVRGHRAIGVIYDPEAEYWGNYVPTRLARRYDAFFFLDRTAALHPLHPPAHLTAEPPETYPSGQ